ncbi:unnamed protein product, partial [Prorocentrum cordatum]
MLPEPAASWLPPLLGPRAVPPAADIHELFVEQAAGSPLRLAVETEPLEDGQREPEEEAEDSLDECALSFATLRERAWALAAEIRTRAAGGEAVGAAFVAICLQRTPALVVAMLGVLAAGRAYVPLEPTHPGARLRFVLEDSGAPLLVTCWCARRRGLLPEGRLVRVTAVGGRVLSARRGGGASAPTTLDACRGSAAPSAARGPTDAAQLQRPAYLMYTSGSTGVPKGVVVPRRGVLNVLHAFNDAVRGGAPPPAGRDGQPLEILLAVTTYCFDISVLEIFWPLCFGFTLFLAGAGTSRSGPRLLALVRRLQPRVLQGTPATWRSLVSAGWCGQGQMAAICGGEAFPPALAEPLAGRAGGGVWNAYGPTEATIWATTHALPAPPGLAELRSVPIGRPLSNTELLAVEAGGAEGELFIGGAGVALGYHRRPELSAERFLPRGALPGGGPVAAPSGCAAGAGMFYRTGDLVRLLLCGALEFLGRMDQQVKFRGFRVELGEIEAVLEQHPRVASAAAALVVGDASVGRSSDESASLTAFVVLRREEEHPRGQGASGPQAADSGVGGRGGPVRGVFPATQPGLRSHAASTLPAYMVPRHVVFLPSLPLTASGKVDRGALAAARAAASAEAGRKESGPAPGAVLRELAASPVARLSALVAAATGVDVVGQAAGDPDVELAALGVDSMSAVRLAEAVSAELLGGREVPLELLLSEMTLSGLARFVESCGGEDRRAEGPARG